MGNKFQHTGNLGEEFEFKFIIPRVFPASIYIMKTSASFKRNLVSVIFNQTAHWLRKLIEFRQKSTCLHISMVAII